MNTEDMLVQCKVPEGYYCTVQGIPEVWEVLLLFGGIAVIVIVAIGLFFWVVDR